MKNVAKKFAIGTVIAAAAGYVAGVLTAPKSGKETRKDIQQAAIKAKAEAERTLKKTHSELNDLIKSAQETTTKLKQSANTEFAKAITTAQFAKEKAREILSALHEGDADDKDLKKVIDEVNQAIEHLKFYLAKNNPVKKV